MGKEEECTMASTVSCWLDVAVLRSRSCCRRVLILFLILIFFPPVAPLKTDPAEVEALNTIFSKWGIASTSDWNISGNPCSGVAINPNPKLDSRGMAGISCDCSFDNNSTCHITKLMVIDYNVIGTIPEELAQLRYLQELKLDNNYLTGPLPTFVGDFSNMTFLSVAFNSLSGTLPKEIGNLRMLNLLSFGHNNFSGALPPELGNLVHLERLYGNSAGLSGKIPPTFDGLKNLRIVYLMDNCFTGRIPNFIGDWTKLTELRLYGNAFQGPIPPSFGNLRGLKNCKYIGEVNGSSSLAFIQNMVLLERLVVRNSMIVDTLPKNFDSFKYLELLDLSFNKISGLIPQSIFNCGSLSSLLLGNNELSGSLPIEKSHTLISIDLSYNNLSGSFPSWAQQRGIYLNLVANNFVENDITSLSNIPQGLNCLQKNMPCKLGKYGHHQVGINCGGKNLTASDGTEYESDEAYLGAAFYYVNDARSWAVSNVGVNEDTNTYMPSVTPCANLQNISDVELFRNLRLSTSSLRYYGLELQNGNYTVKLQFVEFTFSNNRSWTSLGRRVFDIYIQGDLKEKDFDIRKETGGVSFTVVSKEYNTVVRDNYIEIHLFWAGKGTSAIPVNGNYGPSIAAIKVTPNFLPAIKRSSSGLLKALIAGIASGIVVVALLVLGILLWRRQRTKEMVDTELQGLAIIPHCFTYAELRSATSDFNAINKLGEGGFGIVYKGKLSDGRLVAVKQLSTASHHGTRQFAAEIATISAVQHRNLVQLYGCCFEGGRRILVYEYLENKSLDQSLFGMPTCVLDWSTRFKICLGTARGLAYLHEESRLRIIHRDIKAGNILLDDEYNPKISDFGVAKLYDDRKTHMTTKVAGTLGYLAPEYAMTGHLTEKTDVFAFGIVTLEIVAGRSNIVSTMDEDRMHLLAWAWHMHRENSEIQLVDQSLNDFNEDEVLQVIKVALLCTQATAAFRPTMSQVVSMLIGNLEVNDVKSGPGYLSHYQFGSGISNLSSDYMSTTNQTSTSAGWSSEASFATSANESSPMLISKNAVDL